MSDFYRELILDHAQNPQHWGLLDPNNFDHEEHNPLCGDRLRLTMDISGDGIIQSVGWDGEGCAISQASASMISDHLIGLPVAEAKKLDKKLVLDMLGIPLTINRVKCATLSLKTLIVGIYGNEQWQFIEDEDDD